MKIVAIMQLKDELEKGNLIRCLDNASKWADEIVIYDDCSTDGSRAVYPKYTKHVILGKKPMFKRENFVKAALLDKALKLKPNWIVWQDGDAVMDRTLTEGMHDILQRVGSSGKTALQVHYLNLWRHPAWYRLDNKFNGLWVIAFWKNTGRLHYKPQAGLHRQQYPLGIEPRAVARAGFQILHYGFASEQAIVRKYLTYKACGQNGWNLDRLIDEQTTFELAKTPKDSFPDGLLPDNWETVPMPEPLTYDKYRSFGSWEEWKGAN